MVVVQNFGTNMMMSTIPESQSVFLETFLYNGYVNRTNDSDYSL